MSIKIKVLQHGKQLDSKWYGKAVKTGEVDMMTLAQHNCTATEADVYAVMTAMVAEMKLALQDGNTVKLDGFGNFHLTVQSEMVERKEDYNVKKHVKRVLCKFTPASHRDKLTRRLVRTFCDDAPVTRYPFDSEPAAEE